MPEIGYGGSVGEGNWSTLAPHLGVEYTVEGEGDWLVTSVPLSDRTVSIAAGTGTAKGIASVTDAPVQKTLSSVPSGLRWDLVVRHRNTTGTGGTSSFEVIEGTSDPVAVFGSREVFGPSSTEDDQPIALVRVDAGSALITDIKDVRVWQNNGGAVAKGNQGDYPLQYLTKLGTQILIGTDLYTRTFDGAGAVVWAKTPLASPVNMLATGPGIVGGTPPAGATFYEQAGRQAIVTNHLGDASILLPMSFASGLLTAYVGVATFDGAAVSHSIWAASTLSLSARPTLGKFSFRVYRGNGTPFANTGFDAWWSAKGW